MHRRISLIALTGFACLFAQPSELPPPADSEVDFDADVRPLFEQRCLACHGPANQINGLRLDRKDDALKGGHQSVEVLFRVKDHKPVWELRYWNSIRRERSNAARASPNQEY